MNRSARGRNAAFVISYCLLFAGVVSISFEGSAHALLEGCALLGIQHAIHPEGSRVQEIEPGQLVSFPYLATFANAKVIAATSKSVLITRKFIGDNGSSKDVELWVDRNLIQPPTPVDRVAVGDRVAVPLQAGEPPYEGNVISRNARNGTARVSIELPGVKKSFDVPVEELLNPFFLNKVAKPSDPETSFNERHDLQPFSVRTKSGSLKYGTFESTSQLTGMVNGAHNFLIVFKDAKGEIGRLDASKVDLRSWKNYDYIRSRDLQNALANLNVANGAQNLRFRVSRILNNSVQPPSGDGLIFRGMDDKKLYYQETPGGEPKYLWLNQLRLDTFETYRPPAYQAWELAMGPDHPGEFDQVKKDDGFTVINAKTQEVVTGHFNNTVTDPSKGAKLIGITDSAGKSQWIDIKNLDLKTWVNEYAAYGEKQVELDRKSLEDWRQDKIRAWNNGAKEWVRRWDLQAETFPLNRLKGESGFKQLQKDIAEYKQLTSVGVESAKARELKYQIFDTLYRVLNVPRIGSSDVTVVRNMDAKTLRTVVAHDMKRYGSMPEDDVQHAVNYFDMPEETFRGQLREQMRVLSAMQDFLALLPP